jgi:hypothetical protein
MTEPPIPSSGHAGCIWGIQANDNLPVGGGSPAYWSYVSELERKLGRPFAGWRRNGITSPADLESYRRCYDLGWRWSYANGKQQPQDESGNPIPAGFWADTAAGRYDAFYHGFFDTIRNDPRWSRTNPFHFSFHHEQYVASEGGGLAAGTPADFRAAFRHVRTLMSHSHAHVGEAGNMVMCFVPHWLQFFGDPTYGASLPSAAVEPFVVTRIDPGAAFYDTVGIDVYLLPGDTHSAASQWVPAHRFARDRGKSFFAGEAGVAGNDAAVSSYLEELEALVQEWGTGTDPGALEAICWTSRVTASADDRLDATPGTLAAYRKLGRQSAFMGRRARASAA